MKNKTGLREAVGNRAPNPWGQKERQPKKIVTERTSAGDGRLRNFQNQTKPHELGRLRGTNLRVREQVVSRANRGEIATVSTETNREKS